MHYLPASCSCDKVCAVAQVAVCTGSMAEEPVMSQRAPSVVEVLDRHIFQTDYPDKDAVLQEMAKTAYVDVM